ncbi:hypothetical protein APICC_01597 [Apis cerana cerana]|uniref:Uncharacterized protein n=1 Tax=Apis cerana cerana TaxID=94128 RepID=A0A2A3E209_APICC|nr:hypothetical protein APICC_01597 [Apis cerana cerana]
MCQKLASSFGAKLLFSPTTQSLRAKPLAYVTEELRISDLTLKFPKIISPILCLRISPCNPSRYSSEQDKTTKQKSS